MKFLNTAPSNDFLLYMVINSFFHKLTKLYVKFNQRDTFQDILKVMNNTFNENFTNLFVYISFNSKNAYITSLLYLPARQFFSVFSTTHKKRTKV